MTCALPTPDDLATLFRLRCGIFAFDGRRESLPLHLWLRICTIGWLKVWPAQVRGEVRPPNILSVSFFSLILALSICLYLSIRLPASLSCPLTLSLSLSPSLSLLLLYSSSHTLIHTPASHHLSCLPSLANRPLECLARAACSGGDAPTICSIVGALLGALHGTEVRLSLWTSALHPASSSSFSSVVSHSGDLLSDVPVNGHAVFFWYTFSSLSRLRRPISLCCICC